MDTMISLWGWLALGGAWALASLSIGLLVGRAITAADRREAPARVTPGR